MFKIVRLVVLHCLMCFAVSAQETLQDIVEQQQIDVAEKHLMAFLDRESDFPEKYAAESVFELFSLSNSVFQVTLTQWIVVDESSHSWSAVHEGKSVRESKTSLFRERAYFDGKELWASREYSDSFPKGSWQKHGDDYINEYPFFHPRFVWLQNTISLGSSFNSTSLDVLAGRDCVGVNQKGNLLGTGWAYKQHAGLNRVTELYFGSEGLPVRARLLPSLRGNFDKQELEKLIETTKLNLDYSLAWKTRSPKQPPVLDRITMNSSDHSEEVEINIKNRWLLDKAVDKRFLGDPRNKSTLPPETLKFKQ